MARNALFDSSDEPGSAIILIALSVEFSN
jgi:hypothetical protein